jgi:hypothetical protein
LSLKSKRLAVYRDENFQKEYLEMITERQTIKNKIIFTLWYLVKSAIVSTLSLLVLAALLVSTPLIHPFRIEPAFANPDLLVDYSFLRKSDEDEHEIQTEVELPLTRRLALIIEVPYAFVDPKEGSSVDGIGDIGFGSRILLGEYERLLLAFNLEIETPTGDSDKGLGRGETAIAPSFSMWLDLDNWLTGHIQLGSEHEVSSSENELFFRAALVHCLTSGDNRGAEHHDHIHGLPPGLLGLILEIDGTVDIAAEHYSISEHADLRSGYVFPFSKSQQLNGGFTCGLIWHF